MGRSTLMSKKIKISDMPDGSTFDDYPEDTLFIWSEDDDEWEKEIEDEIEKGYFDDQ